MYAIDFYIQHALSMQLLYSRSTQARQTRPNSGGVAEGHPRFDKGGGGFQQFFTF